MRKYYLCLCSLALLLLCQFNVFAQFPYQSTLTSKEEFKQFSTSPVTFDKNGATLTVAAKNQTRGFYLNDLAFTIDRGFIIEFDYLMTGGIGFADGLALVLFDGSVVTPTMGSNGSGLGYSYKTLSSGGLTKGFLAVGIDLWGNFKYRRAETDEYRNGIQNGIDNSTLKDGKVSEVKNHITIRGQGDGSKGYPVLITQSTVDKNSRTMLNFTSGKYDLIPQVPQEKPFSFSVRESTVSNELDIDASFGHPSYRRIEISMLPGVKDGVTGFYMAVDIIHGSERDRIINDYFLPKSAGIQYTEATSRMVNEVKTLQLEAPKTFKIGFAASTGGSSQKHIVRNLSLYIPFSPSVRDLFIEGVCKDTPSEIDILENSVGFDNNIYKGTGDIYNLGKREFLEPYSFQFRTIVNGIYENTAQPYITITEYGVYEYNPVTMKVVFTPKKDAKMPVSDQVYFTIRNKEKDLGGGVNIGNEQFTSKTSTLRLTFGYNCNDVLMVNGNSI